MFGFGVVCEGGQRIVLVESGGRFYSASALLGREVGSVDQLLDDWSSNVSAVTLALESGRSQPVATTRGAFECPISAPRKVICIGLNYRDHIEEMGVKPPEFPYSFLRPPTCLTGHGAEIALPLGPRMIDWEAELGVVVGVRARSLTAENALSAVAGYTVVNDVSARDWIESAPFVGVDWVMQKAWDGFQPTGPWLVPACFVPDPQALEIELRVNDVVKQKQGTRNMVFGVREVLVHLSNIMTLEPGDIIATGTPAGVGFGRTPREFLQAGDEVAVTIAGLGTLRNTFASAG